MTAFKSKMTCKRLPSKSHASMSKGDLKPPKTSSNPLSSSPISWRLEGILSSMPH